MPKELFLQNPVYMTGYCLCYSGLQGLSSGPDAEERLAARRVATGRLEKAEPIEWYATCTLHVMKKRRLSWCSNTTSGQQVEPMIIVEGVSMSTYEYHF
jgi:hypothetical protein